MMISLLNFFAFATLVQAQSGTIKSGSQTDLWTKLEDIQNVTGISDDKMLSIWRKTGNIRTGVSQGEIIKSSLKTKISKLIQKDYQNFG